MKAKIVLVLFMIVVSFFAKAEENYLHDHDSCVSAGSKIEIEIRGRDKYTTVTESDYGEFIVVRHPGKSVTIKTDDLIGRYRMLKVNNGLCAKVLATPANSGELAIFLLKDNRPFSDELLVLNIHPKTLEYKVVAPRAYLKTAMIEDGKVFFQLARDGETKIGKSVFEGEQMSFIEKPFEPWVNFEDNAFNVDMDMTYSKFEFKDHVSKKEFNKILNITSGTYKVSRGSKSKKFCLSFSDEPFLCSSRAIVSYE